MKNYYIYTPKKNKKGNRWVVIYRNKKTGRQKQVSFLTSRYSKKDVEDKIKKIEAMDLIHNADDINYDPFESLDKNDEMTILEAVELYLKSIDGVLANKTYISRESVLMAFAEWIGTNTLIKTITETDVVRYINEKCDSIASKNSYLSTIGYVYKHLEKKHDYKYTPTFEKFGTRNQRNSKAPFPILSEDDFWEFYEIGMEQEAPRKHKYWLHMQYFVIYYYTGMRTEELAHIKVKDIDFVNEWITVGKNKRTKTHDQRDVWFPKLAHEYMKKVIKDYSPNEYFIPREWKNAQGDYMRTAFHTFKRTLDTFKPDLDMSVYHLRHSHGCWLMNNDFSAQFIMKQLGHSDYQTTMKYASMVNKDMNREINRFNSEKN